MKKFLITLILLDFLAVFVLPTIVLAVSPVPKTCDLGNRSIELPNGDVCTGEMDIEASGMCCLLNSIYNITDWIFMFLLALAGVFVIIGAMTLLMAAGDPTKVASGRNYIMYAMIGLLVAFVAKAVPNIVKMIAGAG